MAKMEFLSANKINTTTMIEVASGTDAVANLFNRNPNLKYLTAGQAGTSSTNIKITFPSTTTFNTVLLQNHNASYVKLFYSGSTAVAPNLLNTTSMITWSSQTSGFANLFDSSTSSVFQAVGESANEYNEMTITFPSPTVINKISFLNHNIAQITSSFDGNEFTGASFSLYPASQSSSLNNVMTFSSITVSVILLGLYADLVSTPPDVFVNKRIGEIEIKNEGATSDTTIYELSANSATSTYINIATTTLSILNVSLGVAFSSGALATGTEKFVGELVVANRQLVFERNPDIKNYSPTFPKKQIVHEMPDGNSHIYNLNQKFKAKMKLEYIGESFRSSLLGMYTAFTPYYFLPLPTTTAWDGSAYEVNLIGNFDFKESCDNPSQGYSGSIDIRETPSVS